MNAITLPYAPALCEGPHISQSGQAFQARRHGSEIESGWKKRLRGRTCSALRLAVWPASLLSVKPLPACVSTLDTTWALRQVLCSTVFIHGLQVAGRGFLRRAALCVPSGKLLAARKRALQRVGDFAWQGRRTRKVSNLETPKAVTRRALGNELPWQPSPQRYAACGAARLQALAKNRDLRT